MEGTFSAFNVIEIHQAEARITNSVIENNADGFGGPAPANRFGRNPNEDATIFVRGSQPVLIGNIIRDNDAKAITINANSLTGELQDDPGQTTGFLELQGSFSDNYGPLISGNLIENNPINGMVIRGEVLTTESVWDDTSIAHVLFDQVIVPDQHTYGGLRLQSSPVGSLIVKLEGAADIYDDTVGAGFSATGRQQDIDDRIGGTIHIIGQNDFPVVITSLLDDTVGAGFRVDGEVQTDTNNDLNLTIPKPGDWRSIRLDQFANDRNVDIVSGE